MGGKINTTSSKFTVAGRWNSAHGDHGMVIHHVEIIVVPVKMLWTFHP